MELCRTRPRICLLLMLLTWMVALPATAQDESSAAAEQPPEPQVYDPLNRTSPEGLVLGFVSAMADGDHDRAAQYFNVSQIPARQLDTRSIELAQSLQQLLDQGGMFAPRWQLSNDPLGILDDDLPPEQEQVGTLPSPDGAKTIYAERVEDPEFGFIWVFASETVSQI